MKCDPILSCIQRKEEMYAKKNTGKMREVKSGFALPVRKVKKGSYTNGLPAAQALLVLGFSISFSNQKAAESLTIKKQEADSLSQVDPLRIHAKRDPHPTLSPPPHFWSGPRSS